MSLNPKRVWNQAMPVLNKVLDGELAKIEGTLPERPGTIPPVEPRTRPIPGMGIVSSRFPSCSGDTLMLIGAKIKHIDDDIRAQILRARSCESLEDADQETLTALQDHLTNARTYLTLALLRTHSQ